MARRKGNAAIRLDFDVSALEAAIGEVGAFTNALDGVNYETARVLFNEFKNQFLDITDKYAELDAAVDPKGQGRFHHLYEPQEVGNSQARLFDFVIPQAVRNARGTGEVYGRIDFKESTEPERPWGNIKTGSMMHRYQKLRSVPFREKANILENGIPVTAPAGTWFATDKTDNSSGIALIQNSVDKTVRTSNAKTYHALLHHFNAFTNGGLGESAVAHTMEKIDRFAIDAAMAKLGQEIQRINAQYMASRSGGAGDRNIFRGKVSSRIGSRSHIRQKDVKKYEQLLKDRLRTLIIERGLAGEV